MATIDPTPDELDRIRARVERDLGLGPEADRVVSLDDRRPVLDRDDPDLAGPSIGRQLLGLGATLAGVAWARLRGQRAQLWRWWP